MGLAAHLYQDARWAERHQVERDATLRDPAWSPIDAVVEDLSETGFRVIAAADIAVGAEIGLGLSGIGTREARVVRRAGTLYGCEFLVPLTAEQLKAALAAPDAEPIALPRADPPAPFAAVTFGEPERHHDRLPLKQRALSIVVGAILAWAIMIGLGWFLIGLVRSILPA